MGRITRRGFIVAGAGLVLAEAARALTPQQRALLLASKSAPTYSPQALAIFAAFSTPPTLARKALINNAVVALINADVWSTLDCLQVYAAADSQAARVDWVLPGRVATAVNAPAFAADRGYTSDGSTSYVDTTYIPGTNYSQNSAQVSLWSRTSGQLATENSCGAINAGLRTVFMQLRNTSDQFAGRMNDATGITTAASSVTDGSGLFSWTRTGASAESLYRNAASISVTSVSSGNVPNASFTVGKANTTFSTRQLSMFAAGSKFSAQNASDFYNAMLAYMQGVGAA